MPFPKKSVSEDVYTLARRRMAQAFERFDHISVSFSGGKDSTIALHVALDEARARGRLPLDVYFWDEEAIHPETIEYMERVAQVPDISLRWLALPITHRNACSKRAPYWWPWAPEARELWCRPYPALGIAQLPGYDGAPERRKPVPEMNAHVFPDTGRTVGIITGIRAAESLRRYRAVAQRVHDNWIAQDPHARHCWLLKPVYDWRTQDVWTAPRKFGWDYNRTYDVLQAAGVSRHDQRVCPPYGEEPLRGLWQYAQCWPQLWERMIRRVPGAATAGRYCRSTLYAFGEVAKPEGLTWQQAISKELRKFPPEIGAQVAARMQQEIHLHNQKTGNAPIPDVSDTGLCWQFLYMVAVRGDLKGRKNVRFAETRLEGS